MDGGHLRSADSWVRITCWRIPDELVERGRWPYLCSASNYRVFPAKRFLPGHPAHKVLKTPERVCGILTVIDPVLVDSPEEAAQEIGVPCRIGTGMIVYNPKTGQYETKPPGEYPFSDPAGAVLINNVEALSVIATSFGYKVYNYAVVVGHERAYPAPLPIYPALWERLTVILTEEELQDLVTTCGSPTITVEVAKIAENVRDVWLNAYNYSRGKGAKIWNTVVFFVLGDDAEAKQVAKRWWACVTRAVTMLKKHGIEETVELILA